MLPEFKKRIDTLRDILVGAVPSPAGQIEQITYALIYKFMSDIDDKSSSIGGKRTYFTGEYEKYGWHELMTPTLGAHDRLTLYREALGSLAKNPGLPELFQGIYQNAYLTFNDPRVLTLFLKEIDNFKHSNSDDIGDAYEYLLQITGAQGDVGQFRTPRHIIKFIVEAVNPTKGDSVLDPAVGTAGFLIAAYNHVKHHHDGVDEITGLPDEKEEHLSADELDKLHKNYHGFDIDPTMVRTAKVNMYLHGFTTPDIKNHDSLSSEDWWNERYDVILANPPFMSPKGGIKPHDKFGIKANRAEVLFVDYIASHLKPTGRAGIVVPEGIIFQSGKAYKELRKNLVDNYLYAVVSLPSGVFQPYSGVKTSILLLDKELAKQRDEILFIKIENDGYSLGAQRRNIAGNQLPNALEIIKEFKNNSQVTTSTLSYAVSRKKIIDSEGYYLIGDQYIDRKITESPHTMSTFGDIFEISGKDRAGSSAYPVMSITMHDGLVDQSDRFKSAIASKDTSNYKVVHKNELVVGFPIDEGVLGFQTKYDSAIVSPAYDIWKLKSKNIETRFVERILRSDQAKKLYAENMQGAVSRRRSVPRERMKTLRVPLPPINTQREIVAELDNYQQIIDAATAIIKTYKPIIKIDPKWETTTVGDTASLTYGYTDSAKEEGSHRFIRITDITDTGEIKRHGAKYINENPESLKYILSKGDLLVARTGGTYGKTALYTSEDLAVYASFLIKLSFNDEILPKYYWMFAQSDAYWTQAKRLMTGGGQPQFNAGAIKQIEFPKPTLSEQKQIVAQLESEQALIDANKKLIELYTQKIKTKIAEVWGE
ncbi:MAG TPA: N-6 DNA methylase [Candidatus Saccharimonadales bacterium]